METILSTIKVVNRGSRIVGQLKKQLQIIGLNNWINFWPVYKYKIDLLILVNQCKNPIY